MAAQDTPGEALAALIDQFLTAGGERAAPIIEYDGSVTWLYRDAEAETVSVVGDILGYDPNRTRMAKLSGTDLFYLTASIPLDAQICYLFAVDNPREIDGHEMAWGAWQARCKTDPLNRRKLFEINPLRARSLLEMPGAPSSFDSAESGTDSGVQLSHQVIESAALGECRRVWIYTPKNYRPRGAQHPTLYLLNGESYLISARLTRLLEAMLATVEMQIPLVVFVESVVHHDEEDRPAESYAQFFADELVPWVEARYNVSRRPQDRVVGGVSVGGDLGLYAALDRPDIFGGALIQSPAPALAEDEISAQIAHNAERGFAPPRCYIDIGRYEQPAFIEYTHALCNTLLQAGAAVSYQEFAGDHSFAGWRTTLPDGIYFHFGTVAPLEDL